PWYRPVVSSRLTWLASVVFCAVLPAVVLVALFSVSIYDGSDAIDFRQFYRGAEDILRGEDPYPSPGDPLTASGRPYVYPPLPAITVIPLTVVSLSIAEILVMTAQVLLVLAIPLVLGVRDWRCYGVVFLWPPVISAIQTSNPTLVFALAAAVAWRFRDHRVASSASLGWTLAVKFVLWPLVVWLAATRRLASAVLACVTAGVLLLLSWAAIGFAGFTGYPDLLRRLEDTIGRDAYTTYVVALDLGASTTVARALSLAFGLLLLTAVVWSARRRDERSAFIFAIAAALALSPLVWLHYFALLVVVVALAQPRLGALWFVPLLMVVSPGRGNPTLLETVVALGAAALTIALALRETLGGARTLQPDSERSFREVRATAA
ncbi:MAG TPA: glycosyltransferase family 87 protein, partial [Gaiellaceae bacterium]|nr:glycosyltransferase family 87 protein [Gaiellaceae bacterium]